MRMILQIIISNGILDFVTGIWAKFRLGTGIWYPPSRPSFSVVPLGLALIVDISGERTIIAEFSKVRAALAKRGNS